MSTLGIPENQLRSSIHGLSSGHSSSEFPFRESTDVDHNRSGPTAVFPSTDDNMFDSRAAIFTFMGVGELNADHF